MRVFSSQLLMLFKQLSDEALEVHEFVYVVLRESQNIIFFSSLYIFLLEVISVLKASETHKLVLLALVVRDLSLVRVTLKSNVLLFFNLIVLWLIESEHLQLHFKNGFLDISGDLALGAQARNVLGLLIFELLDRNTRCANIVPTNHVHGELPILTKSALTADTLIVRLHFYF